MKETAVIIVNWNGKKYLKDCLDSLKKQSYQDFDIFLVDNNSADGSAKIARNYKNVRLIQNDKNYGFAKGNNIATRQAINEGYKYVVLLNNDTVVNKDWLKSLAETAKDPKVGACQSKILLFDSKLINSAGNGAHYLGFSYCGHFKKEDTFKEDDEVVAASGAAVLYKTEVLKKVGLLDEDFFMYHEDTDLSWRIRTLGYKILLSSNSVVYHKYSFSRNKMKLYYFERNRLIFMLKNYQLKTIIILFPAIIGTEVLLIFYSIIGRWFKLKMKAYADIFRLRESILKKRKQIQSQRKLKDRELKKLFSTDLDFEEVQNPLFKVLNYFFRAYWFLVRGFI